MKSQPTNPDAAEPQPDDWSAAFPRDLPLDRLKTYSLHQRRHLARREDFAGLPEPRAVSPEFFQSLPRIYGGRDFLRLVERIRDARKARRPVAAALGAHVLKVGCGPIVLDLMRRGFLQFVAVHGAAVVHDFEIATVGATSEEVGDSIRDGSFGMAQETAEFFREGCEYARREQKGLGLAFGELLQQRRPAGLEDSLLAQAAGLDAPCTVHVAIGTDIVHMHPGLSGAALGQATLDDFHTLCRRVAQLEGGVWLNIGSAVVLPEVFLKALSVARNLGQALGDLTTANLDMIQHYRPRVNVTGRPVREGLQLTGQHELLLPLLRAALLAE